MQKLLGLVLFVIGLLLFPVGIPFMIAGSKLCSK